ncbi:MAG TPA: GNAT family N-acetyltransferase [Saprospiraceae bacterium]|nr:GNAT family N-acetyltransferase [Saprospiraceae bacterium]HMQ85446.1 GNAT family N-acetyltransferase [Saprospiraceae bacterium]
MKPVLETARLCLRKAILPDANFILELLNSPGWLQYIGDRGVKNEADAARYIDDRLIKSYDELGYGLYVTQLKKEGFPIGLCGFIKRPYLEHADIGFAVLPVYESQGYTYEAARALMPFGKTYFGLDPILAITTKDNLKSQNLLKKLGLKQRGFLVEPEGEELMLFSS